MPSARLIRDYQINRMFIVELIDLERAAHYRYIPAQGIDKNCFSITPHIRYESGPFGNIVAYADIPNYREHCDSPSRDICVLGSNNHKSYTPEWG